MVTGVTTGFTKSLEISGVGYRAQLQGTKLVLALGYSHPVEVDPPGRHRVPGRDTDAARRLRRRQGARRPDRGPHPLAAEAGAVQGQGHPLRGRADPPQGRQGRQGRGSVRTRPMTNAIPRRAASQAPRHASALRISGSAGAAAAVGLPQREAHLRPGHRRHDRAHAGRRLEPRGRPLPARRRSTSRARVGRALAERAKAAGVSSVVLDRGGYQYHGRVRSLAEGAREGGLDL